MMLQSIDSLPRDTEFRLAGRTIVTDCSAPVTPQAENDIHLEADRRLGQIIGNYRIACRLGAGSMGIVFKAVHVRMPRTVAIMVATHSRDLSPRRFQRFLDEIHAVAQLQHPNIVAAIDDGEIPPGHGALAGCHYFIMEYAAGENLDALVAARGTMSIPAAAAIGWQIASALDEANRHGLIHRDIKPANIRMSSEGCEDAEGLGAGGLGAGGLGAGGLGHAKLLDFGLVRRPNSQLTQPGTVLGTLDYMAPEQLKNPSAVDIRADIFSLGATLFWCLTGTTPFRTDGTMYDVLMRRTTEPSPSVRERVPALSADIEAVISRMMATDPSQRYQTPGEVMRALETLMEDGGSRSPRNGERPNVTPAIVP